MLTAVSKDIEFASTASQLVKVKIILFFKKHVCNEIIIFYSKYIFSC